MAIALSGDARIYYEVHGSGPAVLFVHGSGGHHAAWWQQVAALSPAYCVITVDLRGFGNSRWESDHDARNFPGDIVAVLDAVANDGGPQRAVLVGQSIGAAAALRAALDRPDRASGVILAHSLGGLQNEELTALVKADRARAERLPVLDRLLTPEFRAQRPDLAFLFRQMGTLNTAKMQDLRNLNTDGPSVEELSVAPFPIMLLAGEKDAVLSPATVRRAGELLPSARVEVVTGAPHSMYWETPQLFNDAVASFLKDVAAG
ncbi:alpha/beta hydrolase [Trebonia kvetii]|uniref:Alpha/beta hydrolase n=1 Tax=Trebonia kvetii TaxID=2480626 RepID=A0A6P2BYZ6_9ACTN|nr:alpha/beta hydrolase [Trebonia kvetii]TVZ04342.1 alpha/beta hydrolase [Trebonia kvetii]